jgi:hypothetical protein
MSKLHDLIKQSAQKAVDSTSPSGIYYGTVTSASPLKIMLEQRMELDSKFLVLSTLVQDFSVSMTVDHETENETAHTHAVQDTYTGGGSSSPTSHRHAYTGTKTFRVHLGLNVGEKVMLLRVQGGQQYIVLDRVR